LYIKHQSVIRNFSTKASPSADKAHFNRSPILLKKLLNGTASNPVETCREYEEINKKLAKAHGDTVNYKGTTCSASPMTAGFDFVSFRSRF